MKHKVNEWQELSLKKDVEQISKIASGNKVVENAISVDLVVAIASMSLGDILGKKAACVIQIIALFVGIGSMLIVLWQIVRNAIAEHNSGSKSYSPKELIDIFDNSVCYYAMMADGYRQMLGEAICPKPESGYSGPEKNDFLLFYYTETWYCINKAKMDLFKMYKKTAKVLAKSPKDVIAGNKISIARFKNVIDIMDRVQEDVHRYVQDQKLILTDSSISELNASYDKSFCYLLREVNQEFHTGIFIHDEKFFFPK